MDRWGMFVVWRRDTYPGAKIPVLLLGVKADATEADARGEAEEYLEYCKGTKTEYGYTEISQRVRVYVRAMKHNPNADGRRWLAQFTEDEHEQLDLYAKALELEE